MKTVCDFRQFIEMNGKRFDTSIKRHLCYTEPEEMQRTVDTFEELLELVEKDFIYNAEILTTLFGKKKVKLFNADNYGFMTESWNEYITEKNFQPFVIKGEVKKDTRKNSFETLMALLSAEDFAEWCVDHGITTIYK
jgi:hypothetical protein